MGGSRLERAQLTQLYDASGAAAWGVSVDAFRERLETALVHAADGAGAGGERIAESLHLEDLALAMACEAGSPAAWEHFASRYRPVLQRAAAAIDPTGRAADLADSLLGDLYGTDLREGRRRSLLEYFHGRSRLGTWLRAVLAQRHVDRVRQDRRTEPLDEHETAVAAPARGNGEAHPDQARFTAAMDAALRQAVETLPARDRLLLGCYYVQEMTLAAIGRMLKEHEATVSRHLTRIRKDLRERIEGELRRAHAMDDDAVAECFRAVASDAGPLNLRELLGPAAAPGRHPSGRKETGAGRSST